MRRMFQLARFDSTKLTEQSISCHYIDRSIPTTVHRGTQDNSCFQISEKLTHFSPMFHFYTPWKCLKTKCFLMISWGYTNETWLKANSDKASSSKSCALLRKAFLKKYSQFLYPPLLYDQTWSPNTICSFI